MRIAPDSDKKRVEVINAPKKTITEACKEKKIYRFCPKKPGEMLVFPPGWYAFIATLEDQEPVIYARALIKYESNHDGIILFLKGIGRKGFPTLDNLVLDTTNTTSSAIQNSETPATPVFAAGEIIFGAFGEIVGWSFATGHHVSLEIADNSPRLKHKMLAASLPETSFYKVQDWNFLLREHGSLRTCFDGSGKCIALKTDISQDLKITHGNLSRLKLFNGVLRAHKAVLAQIAINSAQLAAVQAVPDSKESQTTLNAADRVTMADAVRGLFPSQVASPKTQLRSIAQNAVAPTSASVPVSADPTPLPPATPVITATAVVVKAAEAANRTRPSVKNNGFFATRDSKGNESEQMPPIQENEELCCWWCCCSCTKVK